MNDWYKKLKKAPWNPPSHVFGLVWSVLYTLLLVSFLLVWNNKKCFPYCNALTMFLFLKPDLALDEFSGIHLTIFKIWRFFIKFISPVLVAAVFVYQLVS